MAASVDLKFTLLTVVIFEHRMLVDCELRNGKGAIMTQRVFIPCPFPIPNSNFRIPLVLHPGIKPFPKFRIVFLPVWTEFLVVIGSEPIQPTPPKALSLLFSLEDVV